MIVMYLNSVIQRVFRISFVLATCCCVCCGCKKNNDIAPSDKDTFFKVYADISARYGLYVDNIFSDAAGNFYMLCVELMVGNKGEKICKADSKGNILQTNTFFYYPNYYYPASLSNYRIVFDGSYFYFMGYDTLSFYDYFLKINTEGKAIFKINTEDFIPAGSDAVVYQSFIYLTDEKNILVGGSIYDYDLGYSYPFVLCYSSDGDLLWQYYEPDISGKAFVAATGGSDNGYLLIARDDGTGDGASLLIRLSSNGTFSRKKELTKDVRSLSRVSDNHYMCITNDGIQTKVSVMDSSGNFKDSVALATSAKSSPLSFTKKQDNKMAVVMGVAYYSPPFDYYRSVQKSFVYEIDPDCSISKITEFGKMGTDMIINAAGTTPDNHFIFSGTIRNLSGYNLFTLQTD
jgi:hypothetical protein